MSCQPKKRINQFFGIHLQVATRIRQTAPMSDWLWLFVIDLVASSIIHWILELPATQLLTGPHLVGLFLLLTDEIIITLTLGLRPLDFFFFILLFKYHFSYLLLSLREKNREKNGRKENKKKNFSLLLLS